MSAAEATDYSEKNGPRSYVLRDVWYESLSEVISKEIMPEEDRREVLFLTLSDAILDLVMDIIPQDYAKVVANNIDDFLAVTVVNKETTSIFWQSSRRISSRRMATPSMMTSSCRRRWRVSRTNGGTPSARTSRGSPRTKPWKRPQSVTASTERQILSGKSLTISLWPDHGQC